MVYIDMMVKKQEEMLMNVRDYYCHIKQEPGKNIEQECMDKLKETIMKVLLEWLRNENSFFLLVKFWLNFGLIKIDNFDSCAVRPESFDGVF